MDYNDCADIDNKKVCSFSTTVALLFSTYAVISRCVFKMYTLELVVAVRSEVTVLSVLSEITTTLSLVSVKCILSR